MPQLWNINWGLFPLKLQRKWHCRRRAFRHMHTSPLSKLDLTAFHRLFIPKCQATINIFLADHFYSTVNRLLLQGRNGTDVRRFKRRTWERVTKVWKKYISGAAPRILFFFFLLMRRWDVFIGPTSLAVPYELSPGKLAARSAHIWSQRKAPAAGWHHTQTHGPVKVWEPAFGWKQWRRCSQRRSLLRRAFAAARWHVRRVLSLSMVTALGSIVISRWSFSRLMSTGSLYGSEELDDIYQYGKYLARVFVQRPFSLCAGCGITKPPTCFWS